ncbi:hypothetical protein DL764_001255 [Monosporascus ibericus]|uniref:Uncharacterized protein n=1 Tax=Monosporascus ibericus TaxID=155417 RepID=A0A4Q4TVA0_9PEZI|nr:hypothetical protein DL764_001255 [Monosporascus ibericus]
MALDFYLNLPVAAVSAAPLAILLRVRYNKTAITDMLGFGGIWGVTIPAAIFNSHVNMLLSQGRVDDVNVTETMRNGGAYALAATGFVQTVTDEVKHQVKTGYVEIVRLVWLVTIAFGLLGFLTALVIKEVKLRVDLNTEFGLEDKEGWESKLNTTSANAQDGTDGILRFPGRNTPRATA